MRLMHAGSRGEDVRDVQQRLIVLGHKIEPDELEGLYGPSTGAAVGAFQTERGLPADGIVGPETWGELVEAGYLFGDRTLYLRYPFFRGDDVRALQRRLNALGFDAWREDGIYGDHVDRAVREFQRNVGRAPDGIVGPETYEALARLRPDTDAPSRALVREAEEIRAATPILGAVIAIDPGHGPDEEGFADEGIVAYWIAKSLAANLESRGGRPLILREESETPSGSERAKRANEAGAAACVAIHLHQDEAGPTSVYFGTDTTHSPAGRRLAELAETHVPGLGGGTGRLTVAILRETRMPAVQIQLPRPANEVEEPGTEEVADGIAAAVETFLGPQELG